jgi:hypothetical protein
MPPITAPAFDSVYGVQEAEICNVALGSIGAELIRNTDEDTKQSRLCRSMYSQTRDELLRNYPFNFAVKITHVPEDIAYQAARDEYQYAYKALDYRTFTGTVVTGDLTTITGVTGITVDESLIGRALDGVARNTRVIGVNTLTDAITVDRALTGALDAVRPFTIYIPMLKLNEIGTNIDNIFDLVGGGQSRRILCNIASGQDQNGGNLLEIMYVEQVIDPSKFDSMFQHALSLRIASKIALDLTKDVRVVQMLQQEFASIFQAAKISSSEERQLESPEPWWTDRTGNQAQRR